MILSVPVGLWFVAAFYMMWSHVMNMPGFARAKNLYVGFLDFRMIKTVNLLIVFILPIVCSVWVLGHMPLSTVGLLAFIISFPVCSKACLT